MPDYLIARGFNSVLSLGVTTPLIPQSGVPFLLVGLVDFSDMPKSIILEDQAESPQISRRFDRVCHG